MDLERRAPPPCRGRRSVWFGNRAPPDVLVHGAFELLIGGLMHRFLHTTDDTRFGHCGKCDLLKISQRRGSGPMGRIHSQPATPAKSAQDAVTSITVRSARSNAAIASAGTPASPACTAFSAWLTCAGGSPAR